MAKHGAQDFGEWDSDCMEEHGYDRSSRLPKSLIPSVMNLLEEIETVIKKKLPALEGCDNIIYNQKLEEQSYDRLTKYSKPLIPPVMSLLERMDKSILTNLPALEGSDEGFQTHTDSPHRGAAPGKTKFLPLLLGLVPLLGSIGSAVAGAGSAAAAGLGALGSAAAAGLGSAAAAGLGAAASAASAGMGALGSMAAGALSSSALGTIGSTALEALPWLARSVPQLARMVPRMFNSASKLVKSAPNVSKYAKSVGREAMEDMLDGGYSNDQFYQSDQVGQMPDFSEYQSEMQDWQYQQSMQSFYGGNYGGYQSPYNNYGGYQTSYAGYEGYQTPYNYGGYQSPYNNYRGYQRSFAASPRVTRSKAPGSKSPPRNTDHPSQVMLRSNSMSAILNSMRNIDNNLNALLKKLECK